MGHSLWNVASSPPHIRFSLPSDIHKLHSKRVYTSLTANTRCLFPLTYSAAVRQCTAWKAFCILDLRKILAEKKTTLWGGHGFEYILCPALSGWNQQCYSDHWQMFFSHSCSRIMKWGEEVGKQASLFFSCLWKTPWGHICPVPSFCAWQLDSGSVGTSCGGTDEGSSWSESKGEFMTTAVTCQHANSRFPGRSVWPQPKTLRRFAPE